MAVFDLTSDNDVFPGAGIDVRGNDTIHGFEGDDVIAAGNGADRVYGDDGADLLKGGQGGDALEGGAGDDRLYGGLDNDSLDGGADNDVLWGQEGNDILNGGDGDDLLIGGAGADTFYGGEGYDTISYRYAPGQVTVDMTAPGGFGEAQGDTYVSIERLALTNLNDFVAVGSTSVTALGYGGDDTMWGGASGDLLYGGTGNDNLEGRGGDDRLVGDAGFDQLTGGDGDDVILDSAGWTLAYGDAGADRLTIAEGFAYGGVDDDLLTAIGGPGLEVSLYGEDGNDRLYTSDQAGGLNWLYGGDGDDAIFARTTYAELDGGAGADRLYGVGGSVLFGQAGDDRFDSATSDALGDTIYGGDDYDTVTYAAAAAGVTVNGWGANLLGAGGAATTDRLYDIERLELTDFADLFRGDLGTGAFTVLGGDGSDDLRGGAGADTFYGEAGDDIIQAGDGADVIRGGDGYDILHGQGGDDLIFGNGTDQVVGGDGNDRLFLYADMDNQWSNHVFGDGGDDVIVLGGDTVEAHGGSGADTIYGSAEATGEGIDGGDGDDVIYGRAASGNYYGDDLGGSMSGNDRILVDGAGGLYGGNGDDYLQGSANAATQNQYLGGNGIDTVSYRNASAGANIYFQDQSGNSGAAAGDHLDSIERLHLTDFDDTVVLQAVSTPGSVIEARGYGGNDYLFAGEGEDHLFGGDGDDYIYGVGGDDFLYGADGMDSVDGGAGSDQVFGGDGNDVLYGRADGDFLYGGGAGDIIYGDEGDDVIDGGGLDGDTVYTDQLSGGAGADTFIFQMGYGAAEIADFAWGEDRLDVSTFVAASQDWSIFGSGGSSVVLFDSGDSILFQNVDTTVLQQIMDEATGPGDVFEPMAPPTRLDPESYGDGATAFPRFALIDGEWLLG